MAHEGMMERDERRLRRLQQEWLDGGSALPLMQYHVERNEVDDAAIVGRAALSMEDCRDVEAVEELLAMLDSTPEGWDAAIQRFVDDPSREHWDDIVRFAPRELAFAWKRKAFRDIASRGGDADSLIRFGSANGIVPDVLELVDCGKVDPATLLERSIEPGAARAFWLGLAAQAVYQRGNRFRAVALLREAWSCADENSTPLYSVVFLRDHADAELQEMMRSAGVWELEG